MTSNLFRATRDFTGSLNGWSQIRFTGGEFYAIPDVLPMQTAVDWQKRGIGQIVTQSEADAELAERDAQQAGHQSKAADAEHQSKADADSDGTNGSDAVGADATTETDAAPPTVRRKGSRRRNP